MGAALDGNLVVGRKEGLTGAFVDLTVGNETGELVGLNSQRSYVSEKSDVNTTLLLSSHL